MKIYLKDKDSLAYLQIKQQCNSILSVAKIYRIIQNPGLKIRGFFLAILKDLKTYFSQFF
jgi:hypothetical protein